MFILRILRCIAPALFLALLLTGPAGSTDSSALKIHLATLEWPPFAGEFLPYGGSTTRIVRDAFEAMGYAVAIDYLPWARALKSVQGPSNIVGIFPAYASSFRSKTLIMSPPLDHSPLGFVEIDKTRSWTRLEDLSSYTIGTVESYVNTERFDEMAAQQRLQVEPCSDDISNLNKLIAGRIDMAVIDKNVLLYFLEHEPALADHKDRFRFNPRVLAEKDLFVGFRSDAEGKRISRIFAEGLQKIRHR